MDVSLPSGAPNSKTTLTADTGQGGLTPTPAAGSGGTEEIDIASLIHMLRRHLRLIILSSIVFVLLGILYIYETRATFEVRTEIIIEEDSAPVDFDTMLTGGGVADEEMLTEIEVLRSRELLGSVVDDLDLTSFAEFNGTLEARPVGVIVPLVQTGIDTLKDTLREFAPDFFPPETPPTDYDIRRKAIQELREKTSSGVIPETKIIWLKVESWSASRATDIANTISENYLADRIQVKVDAQAFASQYINESVSELQASVEASESAVQRFRTENAIVDENTAQVLRAEDLKERVASSSAFRAEIAGKIDAFDQAIARGESLATAARTLDNPRLESFIVAGFSNELEAEVDEVVERLRNDLSLATRRLETLRATLLEVEESVRMNAEMFVELAQLEREAAANRQLLETFLTSQKETEAQQGLLTADARILTKAEPPYFPISAKKLLIVLIAAVLGVIFGIAVALFKEAMRNQFFAAEEIEQRLHHRVLGTIPRHGKRPRKSDGMQRDKVLIEAIKNPRGSLAEAARSLRTSILMSNVDNPPQVLTITSSIPEEGKSSTALLLTLVTSQMGKKAILVDADFRRRTLHETLSMDSKKGVLAALNGSATLDEVIQVHKESGLHAIPVERNSVSAPDLLSSQKFAKFVADLRERYDFIVFDAPPVLPVTDARILARQSDALVYAIKWGETPRNLVIHCLGLLSSIGIRPAGIILTQVDPQQQKKYGYGEYRYGSGKYYDRSERYYTKSSDR